MRLMRIAVLLFAAVSAASAASAQELWRGSMAGMTMAEVHAAIPEAKPASGEIVAGYEPKLHVEGFELARTPFRADFYFEGDHLQSVILRPAIDISASVAMSAAEEIVPQMGLKYGAPYDCVIGRPSISGLTSTECHWLAGSTKISVYASHMGYALPNLSIIYALADLDTDNL